MPKNNAKLNNTVMVYIATFDSDVAVKDVAPATRNEQIKRCTDEHIMRQRYCVWKLLDCALRELYEGGVADFELYLDDNGKWNCRNGVNFSLSHAQNVVVVAVCNHPVGVDVESVERFSSHANDDSFVEKVLCDNEQRLLDSASDEARTETLAQMWTKKESIFKLKGVSFFNPKDIDTTVKFARSQIGTIGGKPYVLSVATYIPSKIVLKYVKI